MARLDMLIFGYRRVTVAESDVAKLSNILLKLGINADLSSNEVLIRESDMGKFISYAKGRIRYTSGETKGLFGFVKRRRKRFGAYIAIFLVIILNILLSGFVWDVRINGNEGVSDLQITEALHKSGFEVGSSWRKTDKNKVELELLSEYPDISWISINRRGTVAYVEVAESENLGKNEEIKSYYCNVIADRDAVIDDITVKKGIAQVKAGDVVRKGDILISGIIESERGVEFCHAEGDIKGSELTTVTVETYEKEMVKSYKKASLCEVKLNIFKFSINIFKNYGNRTENCDIINETKDYVLFDRYKLPFSVSKTYAKTYVEEEITHSEEEMTVLARQVLNEKINSAFKNADILKMKTYGGFKSGRYILTSEIVYSADIGKESRIEIKK